MGKRVTYITSTNGEEYLLKMYVGKLVICKINKKDKYTMLLLSISLYGNFFLKSYLNRRDYSWLLKCLGLGMLTTEDLDMVAVIVAVGPPFPAFILPYMHDHFGKKKSFCEVPKYVINTRPHCPKLMKFTCYTHAQSCNTESYINVFAIQLH